MIQFKILTEQIALTFLTFKKVTVSYCSKCKIDICDLLPMALKVQEQKTGHSKFKPCGKETDNNVFP